jgi:hypothetical protein
MDAWYTCAEGRYRTEGRVTGGDYVTGPAVSTDEAHSGARTVDCDVEVRVTPPVAP